MPPVRNNPTPIGAGALPHWSDDIDGDDDVRETDRKKFI